MFRLLPILCLGLATAGVACSGEMTDISQEELLEAGAGELLVVDVRTAQEFAASHVPGAIHIPHDELADRLAELGESRERPVVLYCESGRRAGWAVTTLSDAGFRDVRHLEGDMSGWRAAGLPVE
ncbi:MAG: rhodanese-like domain-containing protein [Deltaproteobacteria bacterium]|nr:rhodanese-like domain-containing protein [Deltaproteobacteria bacterium]MBW2359291.1 rhodanese-like domain-containing protein [Deltaproteobacteria bacterium]